jgi:outer membrane protein assembly factor BamB
VHGRALAVLGVIGLLAIVAVPAHAGQSVTFQAGPSHDGNVGADPLTPPLQVRWSRTDIGTIVNPGYPLVAGGRVFVIAVRPQQSPVLYALDESDGHTLWSRGLLATLMAYDGGRLFVIASGAMQALDASSGATVWTTELTGQWSFGSPPMAAAGKVWTAGAGSGGTLYALNQSDGKIAWTQSVMNGDDSSPAYDGQRVFVSYVGPQIYAFDAATGTPAWHYSGCCEGGGGSTPAVHAGRVYSQSDGDLVLDAASGSLLDTFSSGPLPVFADTTGIFVNGTAMRAEAVPDHQTRWEFGGDSTPLGRPLIVNGRVYETSDAGRLFAVDVASGAVEWCGEVPGLAGQDPYSSTYVRPTLAGGDGLLIVPTSLGVTAYASGGQAGCPAALLSPPAPSGTTAPPPASAAPAPVAPAGPAITLRAGRSELFAGEVTKVRGQLTGFSVVGGRQIALQADEFPFGKFKTVVRAKTAADGTFVFRASPPRNVRLRAVLVGASPELASPELDIWVSVPVTIKRLGARGPAPRVRLRAFAVRGFRLAGRRIFFYVAHHGDAKARRFARKALRRVGKGVFGMTVRYPGRRLKRSDVILVCWPEPKPDPFGKPDPRDRMCGRASVPLLASERR